MAFYPFDSFFGVFKKLLLTFGKIYPFRALFVNNFNANFGAAFLQNFANC
ncbi:hypothetical protein [Xanthomonas phage vB_XooS_NR08]|nr:hypothetical protein [Xanthomonas phage vB_XooS_NR08]